MKCKSCKDEIIVMCRLDSQFCSTNCERKNTDEKEVPKAEHEFAIAS